MKIVRSSNASTPTIFYIQRNLRVSNRYSSHSHIVTELPIFGGSFSSQKPPRPTEHEPEHTRGVKTLERGLSVTVSGSNVKQTPLKALIVTDPELAAATFFFLCSCWLRFFFFSWSFCSSACIRRFREMFRDYAGENWRVDIGYIYICAICISIVCVQPIFSFKGYALACVYLIGQTLYLVAVIVGSFCRVNVCIIRIEYIFYTAGSLRIRNWNSCCALILTKKKYWIL